MNADADALLDKAKNVETERTGRPRRWARLWPIYAALRARGFSCQRAVNWLAKAFGLQKDEVVLSMIGTNFLRRRPA